MYNKITFGTDQLEYNVYEDDDDGIDMADIKII